MLGVDGRTDLVSESQKVTMSLGVPQKPEAGRITPLEVSTIFLGGRERACGGQDQWLPEGFLL